MVEKDLPASDEIINDLRKLIAQKGVSVLETNGRVQLYSGPEKWITDLLDTLAHNHPRAEQQSENSANTRIEETLLGQGLEKIDGVQDIYAFFYKAYDHDLETGFYHADRVMRFASHEFAKACYGHVETAVCGADLDKIFFEVELPELMRNPRVKTINNIPMKKLVAMYETQGAYVVHREICKAELQLVKGRERKERYQFFKRASKAISKRIKARDPKVMHKLGPVRPCVVGDNVERNIPSSMSSRSVHFG